MTRGWQISVVAGAVFELSIAPVSVDFVSLMPDFLTLRSRNFLGYLDNCKFAFKGAKILLADENILLVGLLLD